MRSVNRQVPPDRADRVEHQVRARAEQMKTRGTPLGICPACSSVVYGGDQLVLTAGSPLHATCVRPPTASEV